MAPRSCQRVGVPVVMRFIVHSPSTLGLLCPAPAVVAMACSLIAMPAAVIPAPIMLSVLAVSLLQVGLAAWWQAGCRQGSAPFLPRPAAAADALASSHAARPAGPRTAQMETVMRLAVVS